MAAGARPASSGRHKSPVDKAHGHELDWHHVPPVFEVARGIVNPSFVYFVGEPDEGPVKIGVAKDPISRLRSMQTGNPRRLRIERLLVGDRAIEQLLHQMWRDHAIRSPLKRGKPDSGAGTEWFEATVRAELFPVVETAADAQMDHIGFGGENVELGDLERIVREAHGAHDVVAVRPDEVRLLAEGAGYVTLRRIRI